MRSTYQVVVSTANGDELVHEYCLYSSAYGGPVRPDPVTGLRAEPTGGGRATIKWEWSENSFDLASRERIRAGRDREEGRLAWDGKVRKRPKTKPVAPAPKVEIIATLRAADVAVKSEAAPERLRRRGGNPRKPRPDRLASGLEGDVDGRAPGRQETQPRRDRGDGAHRLRTTPARTGATASDRRLFVKLGAKGLGGIAPQAW